jgi:hypothetical protein
VNSKGEPYVEVAGFQVPSRLIDGYQVHRAALSRGLDVLSLPRQVFLAGASTTVPAEISFTHGVPEASGLSAVTFAQDRRLARALLERADVPKPAGASFSWRSISRAKRYARQLGYPVVLREGVGENPVRAIHHIHSGEELRTAFAELRRRDKTDRTPGSNPHIAGYATTRLTFTYDEEGNEVAPLRSRMMVEEDVSGITIRALVVGGELVAAVELDATQATGVKDRTNDLSPEFVQILVKAAAAIPGLACATVDAVQRNGAHSTSDQDLVVIGVSERPRIETYVTASTELGDFLGEALLRFQAREAGLELGPAVETVARPLHIEGLRHADKVADALPAIAKSHGIVLEVQRVDSVAGDIDAWASAAPDAIAALVELLMAGCLVDDKAAAVNFSKESPSD